VVSHFATQALIGGGNVDTICAGAETLANADFIATLNSLVLTHWYSPSLVEIDFGVGPDFEIDFGAEPGIGDCRANSTTTAIDQCPC
jgi:hypothetical protein